VSRRIQLIVLVFLVLIGIRVYLIHRERNAPAPAPKQAPNPNFSADDYVVPTQVHAYDLKSSKEALDGKSVWVKAGNQVYFYPYTAGRIDFKHPAGLLPPLDKLEITNVIQATSPTARAEEVAPGVRVRDEQVLAVFHHADDKKMYAAAIGGNRGGDYNLYINDMFFVDDPHQLYKHWPADIWQAIDQHQVKPGMTDMQADFAIGVGLLDPSSDSIDKKMNYPNGGKRLTITYHDGKAIDIRPGTAS